MARRSAAASELRPPARAGAGRVGDCAGCAEGAERAGS